MNKRAEKGDYLDILLRSKKTIFSVKDVILLWGGAKAGTAQVRLNYYTRKGKLVRLRRGLYAKDKNYDKYELAANILRPSYVSFETVLGPAGITFQHYSQIFVASYVKRDVACGGQTFSFRTIKKNVLINPKGIDQSGEYSIATKERAFLDTIYRSKEYYFDNLSPLDWDKIFEILPIYENKKIEKKIKKYYEYYKTTQ
ncbi:MAG: type IV toxin-antitoxin system AbiEi family antitoxin domain-containing protein [Patescibacteria group bacterium]